MPLIVTLPSVRLRVTLVPALRFNSFWSIDELLILIVLQVFCQVVEIPLIVIVCVSLLT